MADVNITNTANNATQGTDPSSVQLAALIQNLSDAINTFGTVIGQQKQTTEELKNSVDQLTRAFNDRSRRSSSTSSTASNNTNSGSSPYSTQFGNLLYSGVLSGFPYVNQVSDNAKQVASSLKDLNKDIEELKKTLNTAFRMWADPKSADISSKILQYSHLFGPGGLQVARTMLGKKVASAVSAAGASLPGGVFAVIAATSVMNGLIKVIEQATAVWKENFSFSAVSSRWAGVIRAESLLGNIGAKEAGGLTDSIYDNYRNAMRLMGLKDNEKIAQALASVTGSGIGGGLGRSDAISVAQSLQAIRSVFGLNLSSDFAGNLYRTTQGADGLMRDSRGNYTLTQMVSALSSISKMTASINGAQTSLDSLKSIMDSVRDTWRGSKNDMAAWTAGMAKFSKAIAEGEISVSQAKMLIQQPSNMSNDALMQLLALGGVQGNQLFSESYKFRQRSFDAAGQLENVRQIASLLEKAVPKLYGSDPAFVDTMLRQLLPSLNLSGLTQTGDIPKLIKDLSRKTTEEAQTVVSEYTRSDTDYIQSIAKDLSAIKDPLGQIRDLLYSGYFKDSSLTTMTTDLYSTVRERMQDFDKRITQGDFKSDTGIGTVSNDINNTAATTHNLLSQIVENTRKPATTLSANSAVIADEQ